jgi:hypothetical protein
MFGLPIHLISLKLILMEPLDSLLNLVAGVFALKIGTCGGSLQFGDDR